MSTAWPAHRIGATALAILVLAFAAWILQHFVLSIAWAGVLAIATWPIYFRSAQRFGPSRAAGLVPAAVAACTILPLVWLSAISVHEIHAFGVWMKSVDQTGFAFPESLARLPQSVAVPLRE